MPGVILHVPEDILEVHARVIPTVQVGRPTGLERRNDLSRIKTRALHRRPDRGWSMDPLLRRPAAGADAPHHQQSRGQVQGRRRCQQWTGMGSTWCVKNNKMKIIRVPSHKAVGRQALLSFQS